MKATIYLLCLLSCVGCGAAGSYTIQENDATPSDDAGSVPPPSFTPGELCCQAGGEGLTPWDGDAASITAAGETCIGGNGHTGYVVECIWSPGGADPNANPPSLEQQGKKPQ